MKWFLKVSQKLLVAAAVLTLLLGNGSMTSGVAHAQSSSHQSANHQATAASIDNHDCAEGRFQHCIAPSIWVNPGCPGQQYYGPINDLLGNPIDYTYANNGNTCVRVSYSVPNNGCFLLFYVPDGYATATMEFLWNNGNSWSWLNENNYSGWVQLPFTMSAGTLYFTDGIPQGYPNRIGWGTSLARSLEEDC